MLRQKDIRLFRGYAVEIAAAALVLLLSLVPMRAAEPAPGVLDGALATVFTVRAADDGARFLGSAFLWGEHGAVAVTNAHVVGKAAEVRLTDAQGREEIGRVIAVDALRDVAVIAVAPGRPGLEPGAAPHLGQAVWALGAPLGLDLSVTDGTVSALARQVDPTAPLRMVQHDAAVNPGSSGGPLVDAEGGLVGMNSRIADGSRTFVGIAYAITAADLDRIVTGLVDETLAPLPKLGLRARAVDRVIAAALGVEPGGLLVDEVEAGGLAEMSGLKAGDILLAVDGKPIAAPGDLPFALEAAQAAESADLVIRRDGAAVLVVMELAPIGEDIGALRDLGEVKKVDSYTLASLGVTLDEEGQVNEITQNSPAARAGLAKGDRILAMNGQEMAGSALETAEITKATLLLVAGPGGATRHVLVDPWGRADGMRAVGGANVLDPAVVVF
ncbi:S1C family serine protease [Neotabrizicola shimadae]|uniref:Trypsin-like peptidase domain-containing protein n=1 Tax=Neotabrizicola shimadae TaxID=2807096 RepID=A0A8G0ZYB1_9RHOB|nr:trypsin-like peptidase domain-containing protein [Neotabrizicola shimadae]QYZ70359.1 trypsin-like peptidase domain-containing protein [Neotabrizicola shimadae]